MINKCFVIYLIPKKKDGKEICEYWIITQFNPSGWVYYFFNFRSLLIYVSLFIFYFRWGISYLPIEFENKMIKGCKIYENKDFIYINMINYTKNILIDNNE
jgi:hypothetical protein